MKKTIFFALICALFISLNALKILVSHPEVHKDGIDVLERAEVIQVYSLPPNQRAEILQKIRGVDGLIWGSHEALDAEILDAAGPQLKSISTMSTEIDFVDVAEIKKRKIRLGHTPFDMDNAVADLAVGLLIAAARRFHEGRDKIDSNYWRNFHLNWLLGQDIHGSTVGFFGFGSIGQAIAKRLSGFDISKVLYTTQLPLPVEIEKKYNAKKVSFDELLAQSDFVVIVAPLTAETRGVFNVTAFNKMKKKAVLVNISRGQIVNQDDLYDALKSKKIFAAGLDVTYPAPLSADDKLLTLTNLVVIPNLGSATESTLATMSKFAALNVLLSLEGGEMLSPAFNKTEIEQTMYIV